MTLSPEERQRIYEEEKALRQLRAETELKPEGFGFWKVVGMFLGGLLLLAMIAAFIEGFQHGERGSPSYSKDAVQSSVNGSHEITELRRAGVVYGISLYDWGMAITVGPSFAELPFDQKTNAMQAIARAAGSPAGDHFLLYDYRDNRKVGAWRGNDGLVLF